jgi:hypothetical protein
MAPATDLLREAAAKPAYRFDRDYERPNFEWTLTTPHAWAMRDAARLLRLEAQARCAHGDIRGAMDDIAAIRAMSRHLATDPILSSRAIAQGICAIARATLESRLAHFSPSAEDLASVPFAPGFSFCDGYRQALRIEEAVGLAAFVHLEESEQDKVRITGDEPLPVMLFAKPSWRLVLSTQRMFYRVYDLDDYRAMMRKAQEAGRAPYRVALDQWYDYGVMVDDHRHGPVTGLFMPAAHRVAQGDAKAEATDRLVDLALAAAAYRAKNGRYPSKAEELAPGFIPAVPTDPFSGSPLVMRPVDGGMLLYSVGPDGHDDGGAEYRTGAETWDITFCLGEKVWRERREKVGRTRPPQ